MAREKNFDQYMNRTPPAAYVKAKAEYEKIAKEVTKADQSADNFPELRARKLAAAKAMHAEYQKAEADFFSDEVKEIKEAVEAYKEEQVKKGVAPAVVA